MTFLEFYSSRAQWTSPMFWAWLSEPHAPTRTRDEWELLYQQFGERPPEPSNRNTLFRSAS